MGNPATEAIVRKIEEAFPPSDERFHREDPSRIEQTMRPFSPIGDDVARGIGHLLRAHDRGGLALDIGSWLEADIVVNGTDEAAQRRIEFLLRDTCTCVTQYLPEAFKHATKTIDPRIRALVEKTQD